jgi:hypothetical protein
MDGAIIIIFRSKATSFPSNSAQIKRPIIEKKVINIITTHAFLE